MDKNEAIKRLREFNDAAAQLVSLSFIQKLKGSGVTIHLEKGKEVKSELRAPDDEAMKAFCNDLRKFVQPNDTLGIYKLIPVYQSEHSTDDAKNIFNQSIAEYEILKKEVTNYRVNGEQLTKNKIFEVFLYGSISHRSKGTKEVHDNWQSNPLVYALLKNEFVTILCEYLRIIGNISYGNNLFLEALGQPKILMRAEEHA